MFPTNGKSQIQVGYFSQLMTDCAKYYNFYKAFTDDIKAATLVFQTNPVGV